MDQKELELKYTCIHELYMYYTSTDCFLLHDMIYTVCETWYVEAGILHGLSVFVDLRSYI